MSQFKNDYEYNYCIKYFIYYRGGVSLNFKIGCCITDDYLRGEIPEEYHDHFSKINPFPLPDTEFFEE